jgi:glycosyltransferase involved in cell wall biosynthesis
LSLLDIARAQRGTSRVLLFAGGPFCDRLADAGVDVEVLPADSAVLAIKREATLGSLVAALRVPKLVRRLARTARDYDLLYANSEKAFVVAALAGAVARRPVLWHLHDILSAAHFSAINIRAVVLLANAFSARVVANSEATAKAFIAAGGNASKVHVVYNGFDPLPFAAVTEAEARTVREELGVREAPLVGVFGRLHPWKGQHVAVDALARLTGVHAIFVGDALFGEEAYVRAVQHRVRERGIEDRVHLLGFRADIPLLMRAVDVVLHPSVAPEPFGRIIVEGMLAGRPVVAARAGGALEIVRHDMTGLLVAPGDDAVIADAVATLVADPSRRATMGHAGRERARQLFNIDAMLAAVTRHIEEVAAR